MAHTDKTKPLQVRIWHRVLVPVAQHHHEDGVCDLPATLLELLAQRWDGGACTWDFAWTGVGVCSCRICTGGYWHRADNRRDRRRTRRNLRDRLKEWNGTGDADA